MKMLSGKNVAILLTDGFDPEGLAHPKEALEMAGAVTRLISPNGEPVHAFGQETLDPELRIDLPLSETRIEDFDALFVPGGLMSCDRLRMHPETLMFLRAFFDSGKPIATSGHGVWPLATAGLLRGRKVTSWPSLRGDIEGAGAVWLDQPVVLDRHLLTGRKTDDLHSFTLQMLQLFQWSAVSEAA